jgi:putative endonuclease
MANSWCTYLVRCADDSLYCGATNDLAARLAAHNAGRGARYTRSRLPVELLWSRSVRGRSRALSLEAKLKQLSRVQKLALVRQGCHGAGVALLPSVRPSRRRARHAS